MRASAPAHVEAQTGNCEPWENSAVDSLLMSVSQERR